MKLKRKCPLCGANDPELLLQAMYGRFDDSSLSPDIILCSCNICGMAYHEVIDPDSLNLYYSEQGFYGCYNPYVKGDLDPGLRHTLIYDIVSRHLPDRQWSWLDIGSSRGDLLLYLQDKGLNNLIGLDLNEKAIETLRRRGLKTLLAGADQVPLPDGSIGVISSSHNLEHCLEPHIYMREAVRLLRPGGLIYIQLPDAEHYGSWDFRNSYAQWACPEHINHFSRHHLEDLMRANGLSVIDAGNIPLSTMIKCPESRDNDLYSVYVLGRADNAPAKSPVLYDGLKKSLKKLIETDEEGLAAYRRLTTQLAQTARPVYMWGLTLAFWSLYGLSGFNKINIKALVDKNPYYQGRLVDGRPVEGLEAFKRAEPDDFVILFSDARQQEMRQYLREIGFPGQIMDLFWNNDGNCIR